MDPEEFRREAKKTLIVGAFFVLALLFYALGWRTVLVGYLLVVAVTSVLAILIQSGRGGGLAASFGGLGGDSLLGVHSATPIAKATYVMLALFLFVSMLLARMGIPAREGVGLLEGAEPAARTAEVGQEEKERPADAPATGETTAPAETGQDD